MAVPQISYVRAAPATLHFGYGDTPFGMAILAFGDDGICALGFGEKKSALLADLQKRWPALRFLRDDVGAEALLRRIFTADRPSRDGPLQLCLIGTAWQHCVWRALLEIPPGKTVQYGELAERVGKPGGARAVGMAVGQNPVAFLVPCHRVIGKNGTLTGYHWGVERKKAILFSEGIGT